MIPKGLRIPLSVSALLLASCHANGDRVALDGEALGELAISHLVSLGDEGGTGILADPWDVEQRQNGEWIVADYMLPQKLRFFSEDGEFLRALGREGEGPGEFRMLGPVWVLPEDSFAVADYGLLRVTWFSSNLRHAETVRIPSRSRVSLLPNGDFLLADGNSGFGLIRLQQRNRSPPKTIDPFPPATDLGNEWTRWRVLPKRGKGEFWSAHLVRYRLEKWNLDGDTLRSLDRVVDWFLPHDDYIGPRRKEEGPPSSSIRAVHEDPDGRIWVAIHVADPRWETAFGPGRGYFEGQERVTERNVYYDTLIEVIDPKRNRVVASARVDDLVMGFTSTGEFWTYSYSETGSPVVHVYSATLPT